MKKMKENEKKTNLLLFSEIIFTLTPIIILIILWGSDGEILNILTEPELSFCAIILFGQTIVKFGSGLSKDTTKLNWHLTTLLFALVIVIGLIPSVIFLVLIYKAELFCLGLVVFQTIWFVFSIFSYAIVGGIGQDSLNKSE